MQPQVAKFLAEGLTRNAQQARCLVLAAIGELQNAAEQNTINFAVCGGVKVIDVRRKPVVDESFKPQLVSARLCLIGSVRIARKLRKERRQQNAAASLQQSLFQNTLQFPNIAGPVISRRRSNDSGATSLISRPSSRLKRRTKWRTRSGRSSPRSRSGGR